MGGQGVAPPDTVGVIPTEVKDVVTLLVKSRCPIFNALGVRVMRGTPWSLWLSDVVCKTAFPRVFDLTNRVCGDEVYGV